MAISDITSVATSGSAALSSIPALGNILIATPQYTLGYQPQSSQGLIAQSSLFSFLNSSLPALAFNYEGENAVTLECDITDHFIEDNTAIQDQIAIKPTLITVHGFIGDLNDVPPNAAFAAAQVLANKLTSIAGYLPGLSVTALLAYNEALFLYQTGASVINAGTSAWSTIGGSGGESIINGNSIQVQKNQTPQQVAFQQFYSYAQNRTLFTIQTPWAIFQNCAIKTLRAIQDETTKSVTDFEVTFKLIRTASTQVVASNTVGTLAGRAANQYSFKVNLGSASPSPASVTQSQAIAGVK